MNKQWRRGDKSKLARMVGISPSYLCDIMSGRKQCRPFLARKLSDACELLGYPITRSMWAFPEERKDSPFFKRGVA